MTDFRALCIELTDCLEKADWPLRHRYVFRQWIDIARAALADGPAVPDGREPASVTGQPSDGDIMGLMPQQMHEDLADAVRAIAEREGIDSTAAKGVMRIMLNRHVVDLARAVLARWGNPAPQPPAEGEVGELVRLLGSMAAEAELADQVHDASVLDRAADLLEQQATAYAICERERLHQSTRAADLEIERHPVPVPVSERLPGAEDCDAEWRCWWAHEADKDIGIAGKWVLLRFRGKATVYTHWLPAHALPVPGQEVAE